MKLIILTLAIYGVSSFAQFDEKQVLKDAQTYFVPLPSSLIDEKEFESLITLGKKLYLEKSLSANGQISCNSCHGLDNYGVDNEATSPGHNKKRGERNSPTTFNAALNKTQFWDGREKDVESQALGPLLNPIEHGLKDADDTLKKIDTKEYLGLFKKAKLDINFNNIGKAIGAFERTLLTPSRFDDYLAGDTNALSRQEKKGLKKFMRVGCTTCHSGVNLGGGASRNSVLLNLIQQKTLDAIM